MRIILIGFGTVGQSFAKLLLARREALFRRYGIIPKVIAVFDSKGAAVNKKGLDLERVLKVKRERGSVIHDLNGKENLNPIEFIKSAEADIVIEVTPTNIKDGEPALSYIKQALISKIHVITTNKGPLALAMPALIDLAEHNGVFLRFSGTVGGGTPILDLAKKCLVGDRIVAIRGILNGTTNYILTKMSENGLTFEEALREAVNKGYAEADPSMDIEGIDTACKLVILANWVMERRVTLSDVKIEGIRHVTQEMIQKAKKRGRYLKLIGEVTDECLQVKLAEIDRTNPLCVHGTLNAVTFVSEYAGEETLIGRGAGGMETACAIIRDLITIKQSLHTRK